MRPTLILFAALMGACTFPDVLTDGLDGTSGIGPSTGTFPSTVDASSGAGPSAGGGPGTTGSTGGEGGASSTSSTSASAQGGAGGTGDGGAGTGASTGGAPGTGGAGGDGGADPATSTASTATTTAGSGGSGPCPTGCEACGDACPLDATDGDCDADGDPDATDCQRCDDRVFTGQSAYFTVAYERLQGGTSFDYDCSGSATTDFNEGACSGLVCPNVDRYYSEPPTCGETATSVSCKAVVVVGCTTDETFNDLVGCH